MTQLLGMEIRKALANPWFICVLLLGSCLGIASAIDSISTYSINTGFEHHANKYYAPYAYNAFESWMSVDHSAPTTGLFYRIAPLFAVIAYSWSLASEYASGYVNHIFTHVNRSKYLLAKTIAAFIAGGLVIIIPQIINFLTVACFVPMYIPLISDAEYSGIFHDNIFSYLFYNMPGLYVIAFLALNFLLCGLWSVMVLLLAVIIKNRIVLLAGSYLFLLIVQFINERIFLALGGIKGVQLSLFENLHAYTSMYVQSWDVISAECIVMILFSSACFVLLTKKDIL